MLSLDASTLVQVSRVNKLSRKLLAMMCCVWRTGNAFWFKLLKHKIQMAIHTLLEQHYNCRFSSLLMR